MDDVWNKRLFNINFSILTSLSNAEEGNLDEILDLKSRSDPNLNLNLDLGLDFHSYRIDYDTTPCELLFATNTKLFGA